MNQLMLLATEAGHVAPSHIAAKLAFPLGVLIFCGSTYMLLWSIYGAKKGALIYATAFSGFAFVLGTFWWFGAPGTPVATGLQNFPGQGPDAYTAKWYAFEAGSDRAEYFDAPKAGFESFGSIGAYLGAPDDTLAQLEESPKFTSLRGDLDGASSQMLDQYLPIDGGTVLIGAARRGELSAAAGPAKPGETRGNPFFTARVVEDEVATDNPDKPAIVKRIRVLDDNGLRVAAAQVETVANFDYVDDKGAPRVREVVVSTDTWYAFKDPGKLWFPSAVWTLSWFVIFVFSMFALDRVEMNEKKRQAVAEEAVKAQEPVGAGV